MSGIIQSDFAAVNGTNLSALSGPQFASPYILRSIIHRRDELAAVNIIVKVIHNNAEYVLDRSDGDTTRRYVFPNARVPFPMALPLGSKVLFVTESVSGGDNRVVVNWSTA